MSGDVGNAFERLRRLLPKIRYHRPIDSVMAMAGAPEMLLPLLHYLFLAYSSDVAKFISQAGYELMGKSDLQFVADSFRLLMDQFNYHPSISAKQFLARGFAERKLNMMSDVILAVIDKKKRLHPVQSSRRPAIQPASVVRTVVSDDVLPSPRSSPAPAMHASTSVDLIATLTARLSSLESTVESLSSTVAARTTIMEGRIRFLEQKLKSQSEPMDREERERERSGKEAEAVARRDQDWGPSRADSIVRSDAADSLPRSTSSFADRFASSGGDRGSLHDAFSTLAETPDSAFVQSLLARVQQTDLILSQTRSSSNEPSPTDAAP